LPIFTGFNNYFIWLCEYTPGTSVLAFEAALVTQGSVARRYLYDETMLDELSAVLSSYLGHFKPANSQRLCQALFKRFAFLTPSLPDFFANTRGSGV